MYPQHKDKIQNNEAHRNIFDILKDLNDEGHKHVTMVVGDDRVKEFDSLTKKYNGVHYDFNTINIKSAGARDPKSKDPIEMAKAMKLAVISGRLGYKVSIILRSEILNYCPCH